MRKTLFAILMLALSLAVADTATKTFTWTVNPATGACPITVGTMTLNAIVSRSTGVTPLLVFYDATATTDSSVAGNTTVFQDVTFVWNFGDAGPSGTGTWAYGSRPGVNSRNIATGAIAAHLYKTQGSDTTYNATVTATNAAGTSASCSLGVTAYTAIGANGFPGNTTTCVSSTGTPVAGVGGCPAGAAVLNTTSWATALGATHFSSGKRVLFKCGDTFSTGTDTTLNAVTWSIGAYGSPDCSGTQTSRPIINTAATTTGAFMIANTAGDGRIADLDFEGAGTGGSAVNTPGGVVRVPYQVTLSNLNSNGNHNSYAYGQGAQWGLIELVQTAATGIGTFLNYGENNPGYSGNPFNNIDYQALLGSHITGIGCCGTGSGIETVRTSACRLCVFENNTIQDANNVGAVFKLHSGNTYASCGDNNGIPGCYAVGNGPSPCVVGATFVNNTCWTGMYAELVVVSDNLFTGNAGGILSDIAPQNGGVDERLRNFVIERNVYSSPTSAWGGELLLLSGSNMTFRDNTMVMTGAGPMQYPILGVQVAQRGSGNPYAVQYNEVYNNTCYAPQTEPSQYCVAFDIAGSKNAATANSFAKNNLYYVPTTATGPTVNNVGAGNTVSNNTVTVTNNPGFTNGSGTFKMISDFKPTANYTGGTSVPVIFDALGIVWSPTWDFGAVHH